MCAGHFDKCFAMIQCIWVRKSIGEVGSNMGIVGIRDKIVDVVYLPGPKGHFSKNFFCK